jgi:enoyl-[acyl-carrier protein] reductase/trans-2-enoyl-CoA reductase (NAD+)
MPQQIVKQRSRGFICINAHPEGCARNVQHQIDAVLQARPAGTIGPKNVLVIGSSTGYGLATRIAAAWGFGAKTLGVFFERPPDGNRTASAGYYNTAALHRLAREAGLWAEGLNVDAFSGEGKQQTIDLIRQGMGKVDLVVYSLASPRRTHPKTGEIFNSALKTIGDPFTGKTVDLSSGEVKEITIEPATELEISDTIAVMGGEDWKLWIELLLSEGLLADGARTVAYSYVGPRLTWPIYRHGTIGIAKKDLEETAHWLDTRLASSVGGNAWVSVNKAVVTQASAAIPVVSLYISLLFRVMKQRGSHEGCIEQISRLCFDQLAAGKTVATDDGRLIRLDDREMQDDVQSEVAELWSRVTTENLLEISDFGTFRQEFSNLFGFHVDGVDYEALAETDVTL